MSDSMLFATAISELPEPARLSVEEVHRRLIAVVSSSAMPLDGSRLVQNVRTETRLVGDGNYDDATVFESFLLRYGDCAAAVDDLTLVQRYESACREFELHGLPIRRDCIPTELLRYTSNRRIASATVRRILGVSAQIDFDSGRLSPRQAFADIATFWSATSVGRDETLGSGPSVFATFDDEVSQLDRDDAVAVANALALPLTLFEDKDEMFLYEFIYAADAVTDVRFPTIADAGAIHLFRPCADIQPHLAHPKGCFGDTAALKGEDCQPEVLHANASLSVLLAPPRYVGDFDDN